MAKRIPSPLADTLKNLKLALSKWEKIPGDDESEIDTIRKKTRELVKKLNDQIKALDL